MTLDALIADAQAKLQAKPDVPILIMVAGGSATGKSSQVLPGLLAAFGDQVLCVEQDWYQLGIRFTQKDSSPYRWDDPRNFQIPRLAQDLRKLKQGQAVVAPSFDVVTVDSVGEHTLTAKPVIVVDGIYTLHDELKDLADYNVYVTMPLYGRFLRRLFRMIYDQKQDKPETAFKQVFGPVLRAHQDIVSKQATAADCVIELPYSFEHTIERYHLRPNNTLLSDDVTTLWERDSLRFAGRDEADQFRFYICYNGSVYYDFSVAAEHKRLLQNVNYEES